MVRWSAAHVVAALTVLGAQVASFGASADYANAEYSEPQWVYTCVPDSGCQRVSRASQEEGSGTSYPSIDVCRSVCGRFGGLWPRPATAALSSQTVMFHPKYLRYNMKDAPMETRELLAEMTRIITANMLKECKSAAWEVTTSPETVVLVNLNIKSSDLTLNWQTDESYILDLQSKVADGDHHEIIVHIRAETIFGARHGLETLSQLVSANTSMTHEEETACSLNILAGAKVKDKPVYPHRGLMLDTARNFIPVENIQRTIDGMAASKFNLLHWHATDTHSFSLESTRVPLLTKYGAYSTSQMYTVKDIKHLLHYAKVRGIRIVLEIDSPAHAGNGWQWGKEYGMGDLAVCVNSQPWQASCIQPPCGQLNPVNPHTYNVIEDLYADIVELWPAAELFHMGGDEVFINCWNQTDEIVNYMNINGIETNLGGFFFLWAGFHRKILELWDRENEKVGVSNKPPVMLWSSALTQASMITGHLDKDRYVIQVWEPVDSNLLQQLVSLGYRVVSTPKNVWYLDHGFWGTTTYSNWRKMYDHKIPRDSLVLGGEVAMWSEYVDESGLDSRIWPRAASVAERLWADPVSKANEAEPRLQRHRSRLVKRGIGADVLSPMWCQQHDRKCS